MAYPGCSLCGGETGFLCRAALYPGAERDIARWRGLFRSSGLRFCGDFDILLRRN